MPDFNDTALETQLRRFLYIGKEKPEYHPGNWFVHKYYQTNNVPSIDELASDPLKHDVIISIIAQAQNKQLVQNEETIIFALALCAQQQKHENLRRKAYDAVGTVCKTPEHFILFVKFCSQLCKAREGTNSGWGGGWRRAVKSWYASKTPMELAKIITQCKGRYGWQHKDILKLAHVSSNDDEERKVVLTYTLFGLKAIRGNAESQNSSNSKVEELKKYLESVEEFKHCEDEVQAAALAESLNLCLDHVPGHMLKSQEVWNTLVFNMNLTELLKHLQRIHNMGFLSTESPLLSKVLDLLREENVSKEKIHPAVFFVTVKNYENSGKPISFEKRKVKRQAKRPLPPPPPPNKKVVESLYKLFNCSFSNLQPTNVHYMITINLNSTMMEIPCWHCGNIKAAEAGCLLALSLLKAEKHVIVATFTNDGIRCIDIDENVTLAQMMKKLEPTTVEMIDLSKPMAWAAKEKKVIDVFINVVDHINQKADTSEEGIKSYRAKEKLPNAKLINCAMCASSTYSKESYDQNILTICGFDEKVPKIIEAFSRSYF